MSYEQSIFKMVLGFPSEETWLGQLKLAIYFKKQG